MARYQGDENEGSTSDSYGGSVGACRRVDEFKALSHSGGDAGFYLREARLSGYESTYGSESGGCSN